MAVPVALHARRTTFPVTVIYTFSLDASGVVVIGDGIRTDVVRDKNGRPVRLDGDTAKASRTALAALIEDKGYEVA